MIGKVIHYCWFGKNPLPEYVRQNISTWRKYCPDYEIIEWNEDNFNISENDYCREAYEAKKWAFVSDYVRLKVLYEHGGIYMDADVEVVRPMDDLLKYQAFSGYESDKNIPTGTMGCCKKNEWIGALLEDYNDRHFLLSDGKYDLTTNVRVITRITADRYKLELDGKIKKFGDNIVLLPFDYLCAKSCQTGKIHRTENTYTIHHFEGSWLSKEEKEKAALRKKLIPFLGKFIASNVAGLHYQFKVGGISGVINKAKEKMFNS